MVLSAAAALKGAVRLNPNMKSGSQAKQTAVRGLMVSGRPPVTGFRLVSP